ncbi:MAG: hypothetical protein DCC71_25700, partial [Proteobacteria bacterium]
MGAALLLAASDAGARTAQPFAIALGREPVELGAGYDSELGAARGEAGACVSDVGTERRDAGGPSWSLATLSRVGGRLVVGVHVLAPTEVESLAGARLTDAARRLAGASRENFREACGDGFVAARTHGAQWIAEIEVDAGDVARASAGLVTGTWTDPEPFRSALEGLVKRWHVRARELRDGSRADAVEIAPEALVERAVAFPASAEPDAARPVLATFAPYAEAAFSGTALPDAEELEPRDVAEQVFRSGRAEPTTSAAFRAAEMRKAVVRREPDAAPAAAAAADEEPIVLVAPPAAEVAVRSEPRPVAPQSAAPSPATGGAPVLHKQAALVFANDGAPPVFATTRPPGGVYAEQVRQRYYWVPGAADATAAVRDAIAKAKGAAPVRGTTVVFADVGATTVVLSDAAPIAGVHAAPAGERRAWIAGVAQPDAAQRAAIAA